MVRVCLIPGGTDPVEERISAAMVQWASAEKVELRGVGTSRKVWEYNPAWWCAPFNF